MQYTYKNFIITLEADPGGNYIFTASFGEALIESQHSEIKDMAQAKSIVEGYVDAYIDILPPALSYKPF